MRLKIITIIFLIFSPTLLMANPADDLQQILANFHSMTANFQQIVRSSDGTVLQQASGEMAILRPGKFRWDTRAPMPQLITTDGAKLWIYQPDLQQVTVRNLNNSNIGEIPILLLTNTSVNIQQNFNVQQINADTYQLMPKQPDSLIDKVILTFRNNMINNMRLLSQLGQNTEIKFTQVQVNPSLNATQFQFRPPANVDIIDDRTDS